MYSTNTKVNAKNDLCISLQKSGDMKEDSYVGHGEVISHKQIYRNWQKLFLTLTKKIIWNLQKYGWRIKYFVVKRHKETSSLSFMWTSRSMVSRA